MRFPLAQIDAAPPGDLLAALLTAAPPMGTPAGEALRALAVGAVFLSLFGLAELWRRVAAPPVEWTRKLVHFGGGMVTAAFPWIFGAHWTVLAVAIAFVALLWGTRRLGVLTSVHGVARRSGGGLYFPVAIYLVFLLGAARPVFYLVAVLTLVVSDALAAVLGGAYGRTTFSVETDRRSLEGSAVFFFATFLCVHLPLLLLAEIDPLVSVLVGVQIALLVTFFEAISLRGLDNLMIPLATLYLLVKLTPQPPAEGAHQLLAMVGLASIAGFVAWRFRFITASGALALSLVLYGAYWLGGAAWVAAPLLGLLGCILFFRFGRLRDFRTGWPAADRERVPVAAGAGNAGGAGTGALAGASVGGVAAANRAGLDPAGAAMATASLPAGHPATTARYQVLAVFYVGLVPAALFISNDTFETILGAPVGLAAGDPFHAPFVGAVAAQLALILCGLSTPFGLEHRLGRRAITVGGTAAAFALVAPAALWAGSATQETAAVAAAAAVPVLATAFYRAARAWPAWPDDPPWDVRRHAACVAAAALVVLPGYFWWSGVL